MSGEGGFDTDLRGLAVTNFSHHDDIRVRAEKCAHRGGKGQVDAGMHLDLPETCLSNFHWVFRRPDFPAWRIDQRERGMQRRGLSRSRGSDTQNHAVGFLQYLFEGTQVALGHAEVVEVNRLSGRQYAQDNVFVVAARGGKRGHAQLNILIRESEENFAILRFAALRDIQMRHDLEARRQGPTMARGHRPFLLAPSVNAKAHHGIMLVTTRLNMNIGGSDLVRITDELIDEPHHRAVALFSTHITRVTARRMALGGEFTEQTIEAHLGRVGREIKAHRFDDLENVFLQSHRELRFFSGEHASDVTQILSGMGVINQDVHRVRRDPERNPTVGVQIGGGNPAHDFKVEIKGIFGIEKGTLIVSAERGAQVVLVNVIRPDQHRFGRPLLLTRLRHGHF